MFTNRQRQDIGVRDPGTIFPDSNDVVPTMSKNMNEEAWNILVTQPAHRHAALG
jgi:hypothetical protein